MEQLMQKSNQSQETSFGSQELPKISTEVNSRAKSLLANTDSLLGTIDATLDVEVDTSEALTLADLIRNGSKMHDQCIGNWYGQNGETCALSAALEGAKIAGVL